VIDPYVLDWLNLLARWFHIVIGAAWIGTSFYFNWLNNNLRPPDDAPKEVGGELWSVHGGHFYQIRKFKVAPAVLPRTLHWFKYEAYFTWISGVCLLAIVYYLSADVYLIDPSVADISAATGIAIGIGSLVGGWLIYDLLCRSPLRAHPKVLGALGFGLTVLAAYGLSQYLSSRAAYIHVGAILGTCMAANVFFVIIPGQKKMVDAMTAGKEPDPAAGQAGSLRSLHNNYMTLPVLFIMVSNHYPFMFGHNWNWALLAAIILIGAGVRHWFNLRGRGELNVWILPVAALATVSLAFVSMPTPIATPEGSVSFTAVETIITTRCTTCHAEEPSHPAFIAPPKNVMLDTPDRIVAQSAAIYAQSVATRIMPMGNLTGMTDEERGIVGKWVEEGALR
jgi:uncharacterized membrane protein